MEQHIFYDRALTPADHVVLRRLATEIKDHGSESKPAAPSPPQSAKTSAKLGEKPGRESPNGRCRETDEKKSDDVSIPNSAEEIQKLKSMRTAGHADFQPTVFLTIDSPSEYFSPWVNANIIQPYVRFARNIVRHDTDVVMLTHLILYFTTLVPSAVMLYRHFTYLHGFLHLAMEFYYVGTYTLMMHQHIHQRGILAKEYALFDRLFPYITDPLMGHTWNTYYYHHVKHHHVEGNGPNDLSSTMRYQRDSITDFLCYVGRFYFFIWLDLPLYFLRKHRPSMAAQAAGSEILSYVFYYVMAKVFDARATLFVYLLPLMLLRAGLMVGNWGQHAFVDADQPDSDYKSSITVVDVPSNRFCFNDGYHTSHHLNPHRHWRDHPISFLEQRHTYAEEGALIFHNIDFLMITVRLMMKDYEHLAKCLVPIGEQIDLTMEGRVELLKRLTRKLSPEEIRLRFPKSP